jgi:1-acyl-sn-glycerol-3-phosphate acyltransferase
MLSHPHSHSHSQQFFRFIFLHRSWAADKDNLARSLQQLAAQAKTAHRSPLWLLIFPEGTITSDNERAKSVRYAEKQQIVRSALLTHTDAQDDFVGVLHPRSTGLLFCLRTLTHAVPDLKLLDITIGYPGVPFGSYPQEWYGLGSVFWRGVSPPLVRIHLKLYDLAPTAPDPVPSLSSSGEASPEEARAFELWLRGVWEKKEDKVRHFARLSAMAVTTGQDEMAMDLNPEQGPCEVVPIRQL